MGIAKYHFTVLLSVLSPFCQIHCLPQEVLIIQSETRSWEWLSDAQTKVKEVTDRAWIPACPTGLQYDPCPQFRATSRHWNVQFRGWDGKRKTEVTGGRKDEFQEAIRYYPNLFRVWNCPVPDSEEILGIYFRHLVHRRSTKQNSPNWARYQVLAWATHRGHPPSQPASQPSFHMGNERSWSTVS